MLRYAMNLIGEIHSPLNNINRYSNSHPDGDQNGKLHKMSYTSVNQGIRGALGNLTAIASNLHETWATAFGSFGKIPYPLTKLSDVQKFANEIIQLYPRSSLVTELKETSKKAWSDQSTQIAKDYAYTVQEGSTTSADYKTKAMTQIKRLIALAGYRVSDNILDSMTKQKPRA